MESTGARDRIQVSQETADLLIVAGKGRWLTKREDVVVAKGVRCLLTIEPYFALRDVGLLLSISRVNLRKVK